MGDPFSFPFLFSFEYLKDLFTRLPAAWAKAKASEKAVAEAA
jgi:hypothetical protein